MRIALMALTLSSHIAFAEPHQRINAQRAHANYMLNCQGCHKADGSGLNGSVPSMRGLVGSYLAVPGGRKFLVQVPGSANSPLNNAELAELLNWILTTMSEQQLSPSFQYYTEQEVASYRQDILVNAAKTKGALVDQMQ